MTHGTLEQRIYDELRMSMTADDALYGAKLLGNMSQFRWHRLRDEIDKVRETTVAITGVAR